MKELDGKKIKSVDLGFENCEVMKIPMESVMYFSVGKVSENISLCNWNWSYKDHPQNKLRHLFTCGTFFLQTYGDVFNKLTDWAQDHKDTWRERMRCDVTSFGITFEDDSEINIYIPWPISGDYDFSQSAPENQTWKFDKEGNFMFFASNDKNDVSRQIEEWYSNTFYENDLDAEHILDEIDKNISSKEAIDNILIWAEVLKKAMGK